MQNRCNISFQNSKKWEFSLNGAGDLVWHDGQTPAEETVCDPLLDEGVTKGLHALCLSFCEAQDFASADTPTTDIELELLKANAPSGHILANYNNKKKESDPAMPCIVEPEPCPCWSSAELASIGDDVGTFCQAGVDPATGLIDARLVGDVPSIPRHWATGWSINRGNFVIEQCRYRDELASPPILRTLNVPAGTLTPAQAEECLAQVNTRCAETGH